MTVRYEVDEHGVQKPVEIERMLVSTQHSDGLDADTMIKPDIIEHILRPILPPDLYDEKRLDERDFVYVNPTGKFVLGGPMGDTGLTGRKIIVDTYGGAARHGGGAFSGKDPTKVDRSAAYAARYVAKNVVAGGLADRAEVNVAYAIGVAHPVSIAVRTFGTEKIPVTRIEELVQEHFDLRPGRDHPRPRPAAPDLLEDSHVRPLRPRRPRLHVGAHRQGRGAPRSRGPRCRRPSRRDSFGLEGDPYPGCELCSHAEEDRPAEGAQPESRRARCGTPAPSPGRTRFEDGLKRRSFATRSRGQTPFQMRHDTVTELQRGLEEGRYLRRNPARTC